MHSSIAVIIPAFNSAATVQTAIRSVLGQLASPDEIIVVDDGSTDGTAGAVKTFGSQVRLLRQRNQGAAVARQTGSEAATADYLAYLDADDWWPEDKLSICGDVLGYEQGDFLLADLQRGAPGASEDNYLPRNMTFYPWAREYIEQEGIPGGREGLYRLLPSQALSLLLRGYPVYPSALLVSRRALFDVGGWDARFRRCQDFDLGLRLARKYPLHYLDRVQAILGLHEVNNDAVRYSIKQTEGDIRVLTAHYEASNSDRGYQRKVAAALGQKYCNLGYLRRKVREPKLARQAYLSAVPWPGNRMHAICRWVFSHTRYALKN